VTRPSLVPAVGEPVGPADRAGEFGAEPSSGARPLPVPPEELPRHVAIIMDGNRRWARARGVSDAEGHAAGLDAVRATLRHAVRRSIPVLTLYAFSRENWARAPDEVAALFDLLEAAIRDETPELRAQGVRVRLLGRLDDLPPETRSAIERALAETRAGDRLQLNVAFNYGGRTEIVDAVREIVRRGIPAEAIDEATIGEALYTAGLPDPDLVIRTGGEQRLSNFLIWQSAYAEFYSCPVLWPDFGPEAFDAALLEYARRTRRFGR
jgi:undecaprenyl diphosphate synthase